MNLKQPEVTFWVIQSLPNDGNNGLPSPSTPWMCFSRQVALSDRSVVTKFQLPKRVYLGPTAMDAEMALIMANQAHARAGSLVFDPFVGTGSILVAAAHFGAFTLVRFDAFVPHFFFLVSIFFTIIINLFREQILTLGW